MYEYPIIDTGSLKWYEDDRYYIVKGFWLKQGIYKMRNNHDLGNSFFIMWF